MFQVTPGESILVAFVINDNCALVKCTYTGEYFEINGKTCYVLTNQSTNKEYAFTKEQLDDCAPLNTPDARQTREEALSIG